MPAGQSLKQDWYTESMHAADGFADQCGLVKKHRFCRVTRFGATTGIAQKRKLHALQLLGIGNKDCHDDCQGVQFVKNIGFAHAQS